MKIAFDIDNTVLDFTQVYTNLIKEKFNMEYNPDVYYFNYPGYTNEMFHDLIDETINNTKNFPPMFNAQDALNRFDFSFSPIYFITSRHGKTLDATKEQLYNLLPPGSQFEIYTDLHDGEKDKVIEELEIEYFVDDRYQNIEPCIEKNLLKKAYLINQPWNKDWDETKYNGKVLRVNDLMEVWIDVLKCERDIKYYLAGSFENRELLKIIADWIHIKTNNKYVCIASWLELGSLPLKEAARLDTQCILDSEVIVVSWPFKLGTSYEIGISIGNDKPIVLLLDKEKTNNGEFLYEMEHKVGCLAVGMFDMYHPRTIKYKILEGNKRFIVTNKEDLLEVLKLYNKYLL